MYRIQQRIHPLKITTVLLGLAFFPAAVLSARAEPPNAGTETHSTGKTNVMAAENVQRGKTLFAQSCATCHGADATGGVGPNLLESSIVRNPEKYGNVVATVIEEGRPERGMPAFSTLSSQNVSDIVAFLRARIMTAGNSGTEEETLKKLLTGNAEAGQQFFARNCATCHSPTKDLAGIGKKYPPMVLQSRFLSPPIDHLATATVSLADGKQVEGKLLHLDEFYVAIQTKDGWYRSWPAQQVKVQVNNPLDGHIKLLEKYKDKDVHDVFAYLETLK